MAIESGVGEAAGAGASAGVAEQVQAAIAKAAGSGEFTQGVGIPSVRVAIRDAIIAALNAPNKPGNVPVATKRRWLPGANEDVPSITVIFIEDPVRDKPSSDFPLSRRDLVIGIECVDSAELPELSDDLVEPMLQWAVAVLGDTTLGGLAHSIEEQTTVWEAQQADKFYMKAVARFSIQYQTKRNDLTVKQ